MAPRWTVVIELDPGLAGAAGTAVVRALSRLAAAAHMEIEERSGGTLVAFTGDRHAADRLAEAARQTNAVTAAYVKPPEALP